MIEYPPPDPDGRPYIYYPFEGGNEPEWDFGRSIGSVMDIEKQQLELSEGLEVVLYLDDGDEWMLIDGSWIGSIRRVTTVAVGLHAWTGRRFDECQSLDDDSCTQQIFAELLIDGEEDRTSRAVLIGMLRET